MIYQQGVTDSGTLPNPEVKAKPAPPRGILNDFDMASELGPDGKIPLENHNHPHITGTLPFMARDLIIRMKEAQDASATSTKKTPKDRYIDEGTTVESPKYHLYRYDLESFFYILIWAATHYDLRNKKPLKPLPVSGFHFWAHADANQVYSAKVAIFTKNGLSRLAKSVDKQWEDVWANWVTPLHRMFGRGFGAYAAREFDDTADFDYDTCDGLITFEKFMDAIKEVPRGLNPVRV